MMHGHEKSLLEFDSLAAGRLPHRHRHLVPRFEPATAERTADISSAYNYDVHVVPSFIDPGSDLRSAVSAMLDAFIWNPIRHVHRPSASRPTACGSGYAGRTRRRRRSAGQKKPVHTTRP